MEKEQLSDPVLLVERVCGGIAAVSIRSCV